MKISFCTVCRDRLMHLEQTYPNNMKVGRGHEFILLSYGDKEVTEFAEQFYGINKFHYYFTNAEYYHMSIAKNIAHRLANGDFLFCLDADTYIYPSMIDAILQCKGFISHPFSHSTVFGMPRKAFYDLGGYDERLNGWGSEDIIMADRLKRYGLECIPAPEDSCEIIAHDDFIRHRSYHPNYQPGWVKQRIANEVH